MRDEGGCAMSAGSARQVSQAWWIVVELVAVRGPARRSGGGIFVLVEGAWLIIFV
jgi:hypothetical protein